ncbi:MAG: YihY/virulence factor BrkB family protein [Aeromicrobium sp.]|nr:MAG: YihY/virulence factor BrkB family protein [Aeromicrobium sp.]
MGVSHVCPRVRIGNRYSQEVPYLRFTLAVARRASRNQATLLAAGVSFYFFLSLIPALFAAVWIFGLMLDQAALESLTDQLTAVLPADAASLVLGQLKQLEASASPSLGVGALIALGLAVWGASGGIAQLLRALNFMYETGSQRSYVAGRAVALGLTLGAGAMLVVFIGALSARHWAHVVFPEPKMESFIVNLVRWVLLFTALIVSMAVLFNVAQKQKVTGKPYWIGVGFATVAWVATTAGFSFFVSTFGNYQATYGALAGVVVLLLWLWIGMWSILAGACVHAEYLERGHIADQ